MWHFRHCFRESGDLEQCAHVGVDGDVDEDDEGSGDVVAFGDVVVGASACEGSAMVAVCRDPSDIWMRLAICRPDVRVLHVKMSRPPELCAFRSER